MQFPKAIYKNIGVKKSSVNLEIPLELKKIIRSYVKGSSFEY